MSVDYGIDIAALDDLPDPEQLVGGELNAAYACARRMLTPDDAMEEIGEPSEYDSFDMRDYLGSRADDSVTADVESNTEQVLPQDARVLSATASSTFVSGLLSTTVQANGQNGPFPLVLSVDGVSAAKLVTG